MKPKWPIGIFMASGVVVIASFLPWGSMPLSIKIGLEGTPLPGLTQMTFGNVNPFSALTETLTGWRGSLELGRLILPNWLVVVAAVAIAAFAALKAASIWESHCIVNILLSSYGVFHCIGLTLVLITNQGRMNVGLILTLAAFVALAVLFVKQDRVSQGMQKPVGTVEV